MSAMSWWVLGLFVATYLGMAAGGIRGLRVDRSWIAGFAAVLLLISGALTPSGAAAHLDGGTLLLLLGLMLISAQFDFSGVYDRFNGWLIGNARHPAWLLAGVVVLGGLLSALLVNDIVAFALTPLLCRGLIARGLDPRPFLLALALACNAGSAASLIGNPQNILIGQAGGLDFWRFSLLAAPVALAAMLIAYGCIWWQWRRRWGAVDTDAELAATSTVQGRYWKPVLATLALLGLFSTPLPREFSALLVAGLVMISRRTDSREYVTRVDWNLLLLFAGLFMVSGAALERPELGGFGAWLSGQGWLPESMGSLLAACLLGSNLIGNVPFVVLLLGLLPELSEPLLVALAVMSTLSGNLLLTGSVVNLIVVEGARRQGVRLGFMDFARSGIPVALLSLLAAVLWFGLTGYLSW